jgi:hypothetical protein
MAMYSISIRNSNSLPAILTHTHTSTPAAQSEAKLNHNMCSFTAKRAKLRTLATRSPSNNPVREAYSSAKERIRAEEEAERSARETELNTWLGTGCLASGVDATQTEVLSYYKVCLMPYFIIIISDIHIIGT